LTPDVERAVPKVVAGVMREIDVDQQLFGSGGGGTGDCIRVECTCQPASWAPSISPWRPPWGRTQRAGFLSPVRGNIRSSFRARPARAPLDANLRMPPLPGLAKLAGHRHPTAVRRGPQDAAADAASDDVAALM
jgi:hypothetical protein